METDSGFLVKVSRPCSSCCVGSSGNRLDKCSTCRGTGRLEGWMTVTEFTKALDIDWQRLNLIIYSLPLHKVVVRALE